MEQGKNISNNSANFFDINLNATFPSIIESKEVTKTEGLFLSLVPAWGMQRGLSKNFNFEWEIGAGVATKNFNTLNVVPKLGFGFSYLLKK